MCMWSTEWKNNVGKQRLYDELACGWSLRSNVKMALGVRNINGHAGKRIDGFEGVNGGNGFGKRNVERKMLLEFCDEKELCV